MGGHRGSWVLAALVAAGCSGNDNKDASSLSGASGGTAIGDGTTAPASGGDSSSGGDMPGSDGAGSTGSAGDAGTDTGVMGDSGGPGVPLSFAADIYEPIISVNCNCHTAGVSGGLNMPDAATAYDNLMMDTSNSGLDLVYPGDSAMSYLIAKLEGTHVAFGGDTGMMPLGNNLMPEEVAAFNQWVSTGANP